MQAAVSGSTGTDGMVTRATEVGTALGHVVAGFFIVLFSTYFFLADGERIWSWLVRIAPRAARERVDASGRVAWVSLTQFVRATVLVALADAIGIMLVAVFLGVPFVVAIGVLVFLGAFVPMIGATVAGLVAILVALVDQGPWTALLMLGGVILVQQIEGHVLQPFLMGRFVSLHPLGVIVAIGCGVLVAGIAGALVAVPLAAAGNAVAQHLSSYTDVGEDDPDDALEEDIAPPPNEGDEVHDDGPLADPDAPDDERRQGRGRGMTEQCSLADIVAAREMLEGIDGDHADGGVALALRARRRTGVAEVREPPAHRLLQVAGRLRPHLAPVRRGAGQGRRRGVRRQPRPGCRARRLDARHQLHRLHARGGADPQGEGDPRLRRRRRLPRPLPRGLARASPASSRTRPARC